MRQGMMMVIASTTAAFSMTVAGLAGPEPAADDRPWVARGRQGMVASDSSYASQAGLEVLQAGGNAVDAAAAVSFALAVTRPQSTGLGGGGFMMIRFAKDGEVVILDYRETAPAAATRDMYAGDAPDETKAAPRCRYGYLAAAVPGLVAGQAEALKHYGTLPLKRLLEPAITLAEQGFAADEHYVGSARGALDNYRKYPALQETCGYVYRVHVRNGELPKVGDTVVQPALARLLRIIADRGPAGFYEGEVAGALARTMRERGGLITQTDLANYAVVRRTPLRARYRGYDLLLMPPPSSGGICLAEALNILETFDLPQLCRTDPNLAAHDVFEAMKHAFADRARWLGDPAFVSVPVAHLTDKSYARILAARIRSDRVGEPAAYGSATLPDDAGTSHFCVVDRWGNCVSATETINTEFGSLAAVDDWGLILNNEMDDFAARPSEPNAFALIQSERDAVAPGKRPLSSMSPTIVLKDGKVVLLLGGSGGPRIITAVLNVLVGVLDMGRPLPEALQAGRGHHQWQPNQVCFDGPAPEALVTYLKGLGHEVSDRPKTAAVQAIALEDGILIGVSDPRKGGRPAGY